MSQCHHRDRGSLLYRPGLWHPWRLNPLSAICSALVVASLLSGCQHEPPLQEERERVAATKAAERAQPWGPNSLEPVAAGQEVDKPTWASGEFRPRGVDAAWLGDLFNYAAPTAQDVVNTTLICRVKVTDVGNTLGSFETQPDIVARLFLGPDSRVTRFGEEDRRSAHFAVSNVTLRKGQPTKFIVFDQDGTEESWDFIGAAGTTWSGGPLTWKSDAFSAECRETEKAALKALVQDWLTEAYWATVRLHHSRPNKDQRDVQRRRRLLHKTALLLGWGSDQVKKALRWPRESETQTASPKLPTAFAVPPTELQVLFESPEASAHKDHGDLVDAWLVCRVEVTADAPNFGSEAVDIQVSAWFGGHSGELAPKLPANRAVVGFGIRGLQLARGARVRIVVVDDDTHVDDYLGTLDTVYRGELPLKLIAAGVNIECRRPPLALVKLQAKLPTLRPATEATAAHETLTPELRIKTLPKDKRDPAVKFMRRRSGRRPAEPEELLKTADYLLCRPVVRAYAPSMWMNLHMGGATHSIGRREHFAVPITMLHKGVAFGWEAGASVYGGLFQGTRRIDLGAMQAPWTTVPQTWRHKNVSVRCVLWPRKEVARFVEHHNQRLKRLMKGVERSAVTDELETFLGKIKDAESQLQVLRIWSELEVPPEVWFTELRRRTMFPSVKDAWRSTGALFMGEGRLRVTVRAPTCDGGADCTIGIAVTNLSKDESQGFQTTGWRGSEAIDLHSVQLFWARPQKVEEETVTDEEATIDWHGTGEGSKKIEPLETVELSVPYDARMEAPSNLRLSFQTRPFLTGSLGLDVPKPAKP